MAFNLEKDLRDQISRAIDHTNRPLKDLRAKLYPVNSIAGQGTMVTVGTKTKKYEKPIAVMQAYIHEDYDMGKVELTLESMNEQIKNYLRSKGLL